VAISDWLSEWGVVIGVGALMGYMLFIIWDLAKTHNVGRYGMFVLYGALGMGIMGFMIKGAIQVLMEQGAI
jgi:hypothetical protein